MALTLTQPGMASGFFPRQDIAVDRITRSILAHGEFAWLPTSMPAARMTRASNATPRLPRWSVAGWPPSGFRW